MPCYPNQDAFESERREGGVKSRVKADIEYKHVVTKGKREGGRDKIGVWD